MNRENKRRYERVETIVKVKFPGNTAWIECMASNVSGGGLFFEAARQLSIGDFVALQFMLQSKSRTIPNVHFFGSARVVGVIPKSDFCTTAVKFIFDEYVRKEILSCCN
jgi:hypothetical protein